MKPNIHPEYHLANVSCSCGAKFQVGSTKEEVKLEICSECHPFYSGVQKIVDTGGRVQRFTNKYGDRYKKKADEDSPEEAAESVSEDMAEASSEDAGESSAE